MTTTPNMGIFVPADGQEGYGQSFQAGMNNIDLHDHSGAPNKGVPLNSQGIADGSITYQKLNANVVTPNGGLRVSAVTPNSLEVDGILNSIFLLPGNGVICQTGPATAINRTITGTAGQVVVTNGDGVAGNPTISLPIATSSSWTPVLQGTGAAGVGTYSIQAGRYIQLGALVIAIGQLEWSAHTGTGNMLVTGFPFTFAAGIGDYISTLMYENFPLPAGSLQTFLNANNANTTADVLTSQDNGPQQPVVMSATGTLFFTMVYFSA